MLRTLSTLALCYAISLGCTADDTSVTGENAHLRPGDVDLTYDELQALIKQRFLERTNGATSADITGYVRDIGGTPIAGVTVRAAEFTAVTDEAGHFVIQDAPHGDYLLNFEHPDYALLQRGMVVAFDRHSSISVQMLELEPALTVDVDRGGELVVGPLTLHFEPGDLVFENSGGSTSGNDDEVEIVQGEVNVSIALFDPRVPGHMLASPAPLQGIDTAGNVVGLESFGMIGVEIEQNGRPVNVRPGRTVTAKMNIDAIYEDVESGAGIPMWHMDTERGIWVQESVTSAVVRENEQLVAVANLPHFSFWNWDRSNRAYCATLRMPDVQGIRTVSTYANSAAADNLWIIEGACDDRGGCVTNVPSRFGDIEVHFKVQVAVSSGAWCDVVMSHNNVNQVPLTGSMMYNLAIATNPSAPDYTWCGNEPTGWGAEASGTKVVSDALSDWQSRRPFYVSLAGQMIDKDSCGSSGGRVDASAINGILFHPSDNGFQRMASNASGSYALDIDRDGALNHQDTCPSASNNGSCGPYCYVPLGSDPNRWYDYDQDTIDDFCDSNWTVYDRSQYNGL